MDAFSITFEKQLSMEIGLKFAGEGSPFLKTGLILEIFNFEGNLASLKLLFIIDVNGAAKKFAALCISLLGTPSNPQLDFGGIDLRRSQVFSIETSCRLKIFCFFC